MKNKTLIPYARVFALIVLCLSLAVVSSTSASSNKWRGSVERKATVQGGAELFFLPDLAAPNSVDVAVSSKKLESYAALRVCDAVHWDVVDGSHVEVDGSENVLATLRNDRPVFDVSVFRNTAVGLHIRIGRA